MGPRKRKAASPLFSSPRSPRPPPSQPSQPAPPAFHPRSILDPTYQTQELPVAGLEYNAAYLEPPPNAASSNATPNSYLAVQAEFTRNASNAASRSNETQIADTQSHAGYMPGTARTEASAQPASTVPGYLQEVLRAQQRRYLQGPTANVAPTYTTAGNRFGRSTPVVQGPDLHSHGGQDAYQATYPDPAPYPRINRANEPNLFDLYFGNAVMNANVPPADYTATGNDFAVYHPSSRPNDWPDDGSMAYSHPAAAVAAASQHGQQYPAAPNQPSYAQAVPAQRLQSGNAASQRQTSAGQFVLPLRPATAAPRPEVAPRSQNLASVATPATLALLPRYLGELLGPDHPNSIAYAQWASQQSRAPKRDGHSG